MKVVAFNGSPREGGNTAIMIKRVFAELEKEGIGTEMVHIGGKPVRGCIACYRCKETKDGKCAIEGDIVNECIAKMAEADGIILGSPTYVSDVTSEMKALIDRACLVTRASGNLMRRKVGASLSAVRRAGSIHVLDSMNHFFGITEMVTVGSNYWNLAIGREKGEVENDEEGMEAMEVLGRNMAWVIEKLST
jgi:multimeric flavodoxin WrbA